MNFSYSDVLKLTKVDRLAFFEIYKKEAEKQEEIKEELINSSK